MRNKLKLLLSRSARKSAALRGTGLVASAPDRHASGMTGTQEMFLQWNAERLGITLEDSKRRYAASSAVFPGGHLGRAFDKFNGDAHALFRVFFDDTPREVFDTYRFLGPLHFLTFLTYPEPRWIASDLIVQELQRRGARASIVDFGCGLAHQSRTLAEFLHGQGFEVTLTLADVETLRADFLIWWGKKVGIRDHLPAVHCIDADPRRCRESTSASRRNSSSMCTIRCPISSGSTPNWRAAGCS